MSKKIRIGLNVKEYSEVAKTLFSRIPFGHIHKQHNEKYWIRKGSETQTDKDGNEFYIGKPGSYVEPYIQIRTDIDEPEKAIEDFIKNPKLYNADCSTIIMMCWTYTIYKSLKQFLDRGYIKRNSYDSLINTKLKVGISYDRTTLVSLKKAIITNDFSNNLEKYEEIPIGSRFIYSNTLCLSKYGTKYNYSNENFTKISNGYLAQGLNSEAVDNLLEIKRLYGATTRKKCKKYMRLDKYIKNYIKLQSYQIYDGPIITI